MQFITSSTYCCDNDMALYTFLILVGVFVHSLMNCFQILVVVVEGGGGC